MSVSAALRRAVSSAACSAATAAVRGRAPARFHSVAAGVSRPLLRPVSELRRESIRALPAFRLMATSLDANLLSVIDAEIKCAVESGDHEQADDIPNKFPFEIKDEPGSAVIVLTRNFHGENIEVIVSMPSPNNEGGEAQDEDNHNDKQSDDDDQVPSSLPFTVKVSKGNGSALEFFCTGFADAIEIDSLFIKEVGDPEDDIAYEGPEFLELDENLQKAFHNFLEIRGISPSTTNFLHEYMINKDSREYLVWMKKLKNFIED